LNENGYTKKLRQNGTIPGFSESFVKKVIDNPVYMGKIAYGRRKTEKKVGTRNEMHVVEQSEFPIYEGEHEAIISEEDWYLAHKKRVESAPKREKMKDPNHAHILSGILKCPCCGKGMYGNIARAHSSDKYTRHYYYCKNTVGATGHKCSFRKNIDQTELNRVVVGIISMMTKDPNFSRQLKDQIGKSIDTTKLEEQLDSLQAQLKQAAGVKSRLEHQMDCLDVEDPHYDRKIGDLQRRYDDQYDRMAQLDEQIEAAKGRLQEVRNEQITVDNVYKVLMNFDKEYQECSEIEKRQFMQSLIERIDLYPEKREDGSWVRSVAFNFFVPNNGKDIMNYSLESQTTVESCVLLERVSNRKADSYVKLNVKMADYYRIKDSAETENAEE
jgi:site-specific DNA recombinase